MRRRGKPVACLLVAATFVSPAAALGQSAGDEQYEDPFAPTEEQEGGGGSQEPEPAPTPEPEAPAPSAPSTPSAEPAQAPAPATSEPQLPYTGADSGLLALAGGTLVISGLALRRRTRPSADRA